MNNKSIRPSITFYHPSAKGTGCAANISIVPAKNNDPFYDEGYLMIMLANQLQTSAEGTSYPRFDWDNHAFVELNFIKVSQLMQVLHGECESLNEGKGIYFTTPNGSQLLRFSHIVDPVAGYRLEIIVTDRETKAEKKFLFVFNCAEACGLCEALSGALTRIAFGD